MDRNLDGVYFRVMRSGKWDSVCFADLTEEQMDLVMDDQPIDWLKSLCKIMGETLKTLGDTFDISSEDDE